MSALDKLIETHLSLYAQVGGHLDTSKIDLDMLVDSLVSSQFKPIDLRPASNQSVLRPAADNLIKSKPKPELKPASELRFRFQFFDEPNWIAEPEESTDRSATDQSNRRAKRSYLNAYDEALPASLPRKKDWRESNAISEIDNQAWPDYSR